MKAAQGRKGRSPLRESGPGNCQFAFAGFRTGLLAADQETQDATNRGGYAESGPWVLANERVSCGGSFLAFLRDQALNVSQRIFTRVDSGPDLIGHFFQFAIVLFFQTCCVHRILRICFETIVLYN